MSTNRVLFITSNFYPEIGSASNRQTTLANHLSESYDITVLAALPCYPNTNMYSDFNSEEDKKYKFKINRYCGKKHNKNNIYSRVVNYLSAAIEIWKYLGRNNDYKYIIISSPPLFNAMPILSRRIKQSKIILDIRDLWPYSIVNLMGKKYKVFVNILYYLEKKIIDRADSIIVNSEKYITYIKNKQFQGDIVYIPNPIENVKSIKLVTEETKNTKGIHIGYAGNLGISQDIKNVKDILDVIQKNKLDIELTIIGYGYQFNELKELEGTYPNILKVEQASSRENVQNFFNEKVDIGLVLVKNDKNLHEALPGKVIDLIGLQIPIIGFSAGIVKEYINKFNIGWDCTTSSVEETLIELSKDHSIINEKRKNISEVVSLFQFETTTVSLDKILQKE